VVLNGGSAAFVKLGTTQHTCEAVRLERNVYEALKAPFMAELLAWEDHPERPLMVLEDLSGAYWPPPWTPELIEGVCATLEQLHASHAHLKGFDELHSGFGDGWLRVAQEPEPFEALGPSDG